MLIWINGPFGGGKTVTAYELRRRLAVPGAVVCDPEEVGFGLHGTLPRELRRDFQDLTSWRTGVVEVLDLALREHDGPVIAPMTLVEPRYVDEVLGGLRRLGHEVVHVGLVASRATVLSRLHKRGLHGMRGETFAIAQLDRCLAALHQPGFAHLLDTDDLTVGEVVDRVAALAGLPVHLDTDSRGRAWLRRQATSLRAVRWG